MDIQHRPQDDFMQVIGFTLAVRDVMRLKPGGLLWGGHPCGPSLCCKGIRDAVCENKIWFISTAAGWFQLILLPRLDR